MSIGGYSEKFAYYTTKRDQYINYIVQSIMNIIAQVASREPGSDDEKRGQKIMMDDLQHYCDTVVQESFTVHPHTLLGWIPVDAFLMIFSTFAYFFQLRLIAFICTVISILNLVFEFILYYEFLDPLFPKRISTNVIATRKPKGEVKRIAVFNGHTDSNYEWWFNYLGGGHFLAFMIVIPIIGLIGTFLLHIILYSQYESWFATAQFFLLPFYTALFFFTNWNKIVPGANDNLSGATMAMCVAKYLAEQDIRFENTEVRIVLTGSEEPGLRGAKAYVKAHKEEIDNQNVEIAFFVFDTLRDLTDMAVYVRDLTGTVQNDPRVSSIMKRAGLMGGIDISDRILFFGASDAAAFTQGGFPACCFAAMDPTPASYYHTRRDSTEDLEPKAIGYGLDVAMGSLFIFDEEGLNGET